MSNSKITITKKQLEAFCAALKANDRLEFEAVHNPEKYYDGYAEWLNGHRAGILFVLEKICEDSPYDVLRYGEFDYRVKEARKNEINEQDKEDAK